MTYVDRSGGRGQIRVGTDGPESRQITAHRPDAVRVPVARFKCRKLDSLLNIMYNTRTYNVGIRVLVDT